MRKRVNKKTKCDWYWVLLGAFFALLIAFTYVSYKLYKERGKDEIKNYMLTKAIDEFTGCDDQRNKQILNVVNSEGGRLAVIEGYVTRKLESLNSNNQNEPASPPVGLKRLPPPPPMEASGIVFDTPPPAMECGVLDTESVPPRH